MNYKKRGTVLVFILMMLFAVSGVYAEDEAHTGTVIQKERAGNYIYLKLYEEGRDVWLSALPFDVAPGDKVEYKGGVPMKNFKSKGLNRTFESIIFITRISVVGRESKPDGDQGPADALHTKSANKKKTVSMPQKGEITRAESGKTIQEIFSEKEQLKDKEVILRAKTIKVNRNILGKNWITLSDGTGTAPDNKLIATTLEDVEPGEILTVKGIVKNDINLGKGYKYKVVIENAKFTK